MNLIRRELNDATSDYQKARLYLIETNQYIKFNECPFTRRAEIKGAAMSCLNRSRARLMNVVKAANVILGRCAV